MGIKRYEKIIHATTYNSTTGHRKKALDGTVATLTSESSIALYRIAAAYPEDEVSILVIRMLHR